MEMASAISRFPRRTANYKPNIWNYDLLQSLTSKYHEEQEGESESVKEQVCGVFCALKDPLHKLELIDWIEKLALSHYFEEQISNSVKEIALGVDDAAHPYSAAFYFRILRQHGFYVPQDAIVKLLDDEEAKLIWDEKARAEIFEASHLALEDECLFDRAKNLISDYPVSWANNWHRSVRWFSVRKHMHAYANDKSSISLIQRLAGLSFNAIQLQHHKDLNHILRN